MVTLIVHLFAQAGVTAPYIKNLNALLYTLALLQSVSDERPTEVNGRNIRTRVPGVDLYVLDRQRNLVRQFKFLTTGRYVIGFTRNFDLVWT